MGLGLQNQDMVENLSLADTQNSFNAPNPEIEDKEGEHITVGA